LLIDYDDDDDDEEEEEEQGDDGGNVVRVCFAWVVCGL
jgi:hypothetical protein